MPTNGPARPEQRAQSARGGRRSRFTAAELVAAGRFRVIQATRFQWAVIEGWLEHEGGSPGLADADIYFRLDPGGHFLGVLDGVPVSAVSVVNYGPRMAFLGNYFVRADQRGQGLGLATWRIAVAHAAGRAIGVEAALGRAGLYRRAGFSELYKTITYQGRIPRGGRVTAGSGVVPYQARHAAAITALDGACFPQNRRPFADAWATSLGHRTLVRTCDDEVTGYGVIGPTNRGYRIGPLVAKTQDDALVLFNALTEPYPSVTVAFHAPEPNIAALLLARAHGLTEISRTARMYTQPTRPIALARSFAIGSLAYG